MINHERGKVQGVGSALQVPFPGHINLLMLTAHTATTFIFPKIKNLSVMSKIYDVQYLFISLICISWNSGD